MNHMTPIAKFYRLIPNCRLPQRADRSAAGTIPTRAFRFCEALTSASAFGWYIFPPISFSLMWDGSDIIWSYEGCSEWYPLTTAQFPDFSDYFDSVKPEFKGYSPPFLSSLVEPGVVQIWSGLIARTLPDWSLLIRSPVNMVRNLGYECYEGIVETDRWFGPLFTNIRLTKTDTPIEFDANFPFIQAQPIQRNSYGNIIDSFSVIEDMNDFSDEDWENYQRTVIEPNIKPDRQLGSYAVCTRRRNKGNL